MLLCYSWQPLVRDWFIILDGFDMAWNVKVLSFCMYLFAENLRALAHFGPYGWVRCHLNAKHLSGRQASGAL